MFNRTGEKTTEQSTFRTDNAVSIDFDQQQFSLANFNSEPLLTIIVTIACSKRVRHHTSTVIKLENQNLNWVVVGPRGQAAPCIPPDQSRLSQLILRAHLIAFIILSLK